MKKVNTKPKTFITIDPKDHILIDYVMIKHINNGYFKAKFYSKEKIKLGYGVVGYKENFKEFNNIMSWRVNVPTD